MNRVILLLFCLSINHLFAQMINNESREDRRMDIIKTRFN